MYCSCERRRKLSRLSASNTNLHDSNECVSWGQRNPGFPLTAWIFCLLGPSDPLIRVTICSFSSLSASCRSSSTLERQWPKPRCEFQVQGRLGTNMVIHKRLQEYKISTHTKSIHWELGACLCTTASLGRNALKHFCSTDQVLKEILAKNKRETGNLVRLGDEFPAVKNANN